MIRKHMPLRAEVRDMELESSHVGCVHFLFLTPTPHDVLPWPLGYTGTSGEAVYSTHQLISFLREPLVAQPLSCLMPISLLPLTHVCLCGSLPLLPQRSLPQQAAACSNPTPF